MSTKATVQKNYRTNLNTLANFFSSKSLTFREPNIVCAKGVAENEVVIEFQEPLYLRDWPYRTKSKERIDVIVDILETVRLENPCCCVRSTVYLDYYRVDGESKVFASDAMHFDFQNPPQKRHPFCHAQAKNSLIEKVPELFNRTRSEVDSEAIKRRNQSVRIPTAYLNFAGVISMLAADHLDEDQYQDFVEKMEPILLGFPPHGEHECINEVIKSRRISSFYWYK